MLSSRRSPDPDASPEVVVVGAGPTGLLLAGDLARSGVAVTLLEQRTERSGLTRAFAVHARTLEVLDARGLADDLIATGTPVPGVALHGEVTIDLSSLPSRFPYVLITPQFHTERLLLARAERLGVRVRLGVTVTGLTQDHAGVDVTITAEDGRAETLRARYLVGADGHRSRVRSALGVDFPGESVVRSLILADVRLDDPPRDLIAVDATPQGFAFVAPFGDGWHRVIARRTGDDRPDDVPVDLSEVRAALHAALGTDHGLRETRWTSRFHSDERQVERYRVGRVFLAGDAAHVHSPAGGMGMNTGLQDAANLAWRLAVALRRTDPDRVLDGYHDERHRVGRLVLRLSGGLIRAVLTTSGFGRRVRDVLIGLATSVPVTARRMRGLVSGIGLGYPRPPGAHRRVGSREPDTVGVAGDRLAEALRDGGFVVVTPRPFAAPPGVRVLEVAAGPIRIVRPDGYVGWAGTDPARARQALRRLGAEDLGAGLRSAAGRSR